MKTLFIALLLLVGSTSSYAEVTIDVRQAVEKMMSVYYSSNYDKLRGCTLYDDGAETYCLVPKHYEVKESEETETLYVLVSGDTIEDGARVTPGMGGLFILYKLGKSWVVSSSSPYIKNGGAGRSQLKDFDLREVGDDKYGWVGSHCGSGAGGQTNCFWEMYAPVDSGEIEQVAQLPSDYSYEFMSAPGYTKIEGSVHIESYQPMTAGFYPLTMTHDSESGEYDKNYELIPKSVKKSEERYTVSFDQKTQTFIAPEDF